MPRSWSENIMATTFHELDFLGAAVRLLRRTHGGFGQNRGDRGRFKSGHGGTHQHCFGIYLEHFFFCQCQRDGRALEVISAHMELSRTVRRRNGALVALLLSSAPTRRRLPRGSG